MIAWWNDWKARDQRAKIERTFNHGRFSKEKKKKKKKKKTLNTKAISNIFDVITHRFRVKQQKD